MENWENLLYFLACYSFYFAGTFSIITLGYFTGYLNFIKYTQNVWEVFTNQKIDDINFYHSNYKYWYFIGFYMMFTSTTFLFSVYMWLLYYLIPYTWYFLTPFILTFIFANIYTIYKIPKYWKLIKNKNYVNVKIAIDNFKHYQNTIKEDAKFNEFKLYKFDKVAPRNQPFQFNQWRYKGKIRRLNNKKYNEEKYNLKLLNMYIRYLKTYAIFYKALETRLKDFIDDYSVEINNQKYETLEPLKQVLIDNFFYYVNKK